MNFSKKTSNKNSFIIFAILLCGVIFPAEKTFAISGREIMEKVNARDVGDSSSGEMEMILIDKKGKKRIRKLKTFGGKKGKDSLSLMFFISPADVKNTGFLTYDYKKSGKDDDQWLYLPALRKTKRIAAGDKSGSFMGLVTCWYENGQKMYEGTLVYGQEVSVKEWNEDGSVKE